ncbi:MAG: DUF3179 domain-containing protein [Gemmatimonadetes bacterium]|nr:DUF3179 domain-containing protein [Gemmatimonadota bacterium]MBT5055330.1 DUF3179 domain-containing protein [Gemmatimonadota bacterium]MBT5142801.1 DUF3179 domain-containing protein [Gemmatimonadota bacterium]MBT5589393.1 DUF3179 domain-containing protein [Gemmatimonadota bacterium]MBT5960065.1 DUF3179 domain-containing protein [Gemmatimonadota bacterium]
MVPASIVYDSRLSTGVLADRARLTHPDLRFGVTGILRQGALVMYDRSTVSLWRQDGWAIAGPLKGTRLKRLPSERMSWHQWRERHPLTLVMRAPPPAPYPRPRVPVRLDP